MKTTFFACVVALLSPLALGFLPTPSYVVMKPLVAGTAHRPLAISSWRSSFALKSTEESTVENQAAPVEPPTSFTPPTETQAERNLNFMSNARSRRGGTVDEDGKSNVWAFEPQEEAQVVGSNNAGLVLGALAAVLLAAVAVLPNVEFPSFD